MQTKSELVIHNQYNIAHICTSKQCDMGRGNDDALLDRLGDAGAKVRKAF